MKSLFKLEATHRFDEYFSKIPVCKLPLMLTVVIKDVPSRPQTARTENQPLVGVEHVELLKMFSRSCFQTLLGRHAK